MILLGAGRSDAAERPRHTSGKPSVSIASYLLFAVSLAVFIGGLEYVYAGYLATRFGYLGYSYQEPDRVWMIGSYLLLLVVAIFLPYKPTRASGFALWFLYVALVVPIATIPLFGSARAPADTFFFALYCSVVWVLVALALKPGVPALVPVRESGEKLLWIVIGLVSLSTYVYLSLVFGLTINLLSVFDVYETRLEYRDQLVPTVPLLGYLITNQGNVINPLLIALGAYRKKWALVALGALGQLVIYSTTGYKTVLISIPICLVLALVLRRRNAFFGYGVIVGSVVLVWSCIVIDRIVSLGLIDIVVSRVFATAGYLMPLYRDVYDDNPPALWAYSFLSSFIESSYDTSPGFQVARETLGRSDVQLNASLFADGYANLGLAGIAIEAAALAIILILIDSASRRLPLALVVPTSVLPVFSLANGSPFTALLSYGFVLMAVVFALMPRNRTAVGPGATLRARRQAPLK